MRTNEMRTVSYIKKRKTDIVKTPTTEISQSERKIFESVEINYNNSQLRKNSN